jgi:hypothetical protein
MTSSIYHPNENLHMKSKKVDVVDVIILREIYIKEIYLLKF